MSTSTLRQPPRFDSYSFRKYMNDTGWAYRNQAIGMIGFCLAFSKAAEQTSTQDADLTEVLQACDKALLHAGKSREANRASVGDIERAIRQLKYYDERFHESIHIDAVEECMKEAKEKDKKKPAKIKQFEEPSSKVIEFHIMKNLNMDDPQCTVVRQVLKNDTKQEEVLWNFIRIEDEKKRLTLSQNAHFYNNLPTLPTTSWGEFRIRATVENWHTHHPEPIYVLTNTLGRVFLDFGRPPRAFDVLDMNEIVILKSGCGELWGECLVKASILQGDLYPCFHVETLPSLPVVGAAVDPQNSSTSPTNSLACVPITDLNGALRQALHSPDIKILLKRCSGCTVPSAVAYPLPDVVPWTMNSEGSIPRSRSRNTI